VKANARLMNLSDLAPGASYTPVALERDALLQTYICVDGTIQRFYGFCTFYRIIVQFSF